MHDSTVAIRTAPDTEPRSTPLDGPQVDKSEVVSTHVLVEQEQVEKLRELSRRTRVAQSEYLREAVDDLLSKYNKPPTEGA